MAKKYLLILQQNPNNKTYASEALDIALGIAALEQHVSLLFIDDGVLQLLIPENLKILSALSLYDINDTFVSQTSLQHHNLDYSKLKLQPTIVTADKIAKLCETNDIVISL